MNRTGFSFHPTSRQPRLRLSAKPQAMIGLCRLDLKDRGRFAGGNRGRHHDQAAVGNFGQLLNRTVV